MEKKVALITGGSRGIGKAIAEKFAKNGYDLVINYVSDNTDLEAIKEEFKQYGSEVLMEKADVSNYAECEKMVTSAIEKFGRIDVLVNNAGVTRDNLLMRMKEEDFDKVISINLKGTFNLTKLVTPYMMKRREGRIVSISSNCVAPGFIATDMTAVLNDKVKESINAQIPLKRMGTAEEIANAVYFLGGEENTYITGQTLNIDGGMI